MYSDIVMEHFRRPVYVGPLQSPDAVGACGVVGRGNYVIVHIVVTDGCITECGYQTYGCAPAIAAGSVLMAMIKGMPLADAVQITADTLEDAMGGLPLGRRHCAAQAVEALQDALGRLGTAE